MFAQMCSGASGGIAVCMKILIINAGSSSIKFNLYETEGEQCLAKGLIERIRAPGTNLRYTNHKGVKVEQKISANSYEAAISEACLALSAPQTGVIESLTEIKAIGHRVVHGGAAISGAVRITPQVKQVIMDCFDLAPIHNPPNLEGIEACEQLFPSIPMVAVFDTAFHQTMPPVSYTYAIPIEIAHKYKIRKYGFHGTSHHYVALSAAEHLGRPLEDLKLITVHLGNGCSITAVNRGKVEDTSMGLTPLEGLMMGTRCGDIDPAVVMHLSRIGFSLEDIDKMLNKQSGIIGLSGIGSGDMRDLLKAVHDGNTQAQLALAVYNHRIVKYVGAYSAELKGFDALVFTGGIGENVASIRASVCDHLGFLGVQLDPVRNRAHEIIITRDEIAPRVMVVPTNEELMIARQTHALLFQ